jgi:hypothetical protein
MIGGNALGDGSKKDDKEEKREMTWQEKYRSELKKDVDDLGKDEEDEDTKSDSAEDSDGLSDDHPDY